MNLAVVWYPFSSGYEHIESTLNDYNVFNLNESNSSLLSNLVDVPSKDLKDLLSVFVTQLEHESVDTVHDMFYPTKGVENVDLVVRSWFESSNPTVHVLACLWVLSKADLFVSTTESRACIDIGPQLMICKQLGVTSVGVGPSPQSLWFQAMFDVVCRRNALSRVLEGYNGTKTPDRKNS